MSVDLRIKPCPFCGGGGAATVWHYGYWSIKCSLCERDNKNACEQDWGEFDSEEHAIEAWNRRAESPERTCRCIEGTVPCYARNSATTPVTELQSCIKACVYICSSCKCVLGRMGTGIPLPEYGYCSGCGARIEKEVAHE